MARYFLFQLLVCTLNNLKIPVWQSGRILPAKQPEQKQLLTQQRIKRPNQDSRSATQSPARENSVREEPRQKRKRANSLPPPPTLGANRGNRASSLLHPGTSTSGEPIIPKKSNTIIVPPAPSVTTIGSAPTF